MVMERLDAVNEHPGNNDPVKPFAIKQAKRILPEAGVTDPCPKGQRVKTPKGKEAPAVTELNLKAEWQRQSQNFLALGFHQEIGCPDTDKGRQAYLDSLPKFEPQPREYKGRFDQLLLVEKRIYWPRQAILAKIAISDYLLASIDRVQDWQDNHSKAPKTAYCGWFNQWGQEFPEMISPLAARNQLASDATGGDVYEGIARQIHLPDENENGKYFTLIVSQVGSDSVVYLYHWFSGPRLYALLGNCAHPYFRPLVRGSEIVTL